MRSARSRFGLSIRQRSAKMLRAPPDISLPITTPPCPSFIVQLRMTTFSIGTARRRPSSFRPDLIAMQSSPVSNVQPSMSTSRHDSGSHPSLFGPWLLTATLRTVTFVQSTGWISHIGELQDGDAVDEDVLAAVWLDEVRPQERPGPEHALRDRHAARAHLEEACAGRHLRGFGRQGPGALPGPPVLVARLAVERALAGDRDVALLEGVDERRVVHQLDAFPPREDHGQEVIGVAAEGDCRAVGQVEVDPALQMDGAGQEPAVRHEHPAAAGGGARGDGVAERGRAVADAVARGAVLRHRKDAIGKHRRTDAGEDGVRFSPAAMGGLRREQPARAAARQQARRGEQPGASQCAAGEEIPAGHAMVTHDSSCATAFSGRRRVGGAARSGVRGTPRRPRDAPAALNEGRPRRRGCRRRGWP